MRTDRQGLDRDAAERMLDGVSSDPASAPRFLADLLAAASVPARDAELAGEEAAVAAFHAALSPGDPSPQEPGRARFPRARLLPVKFAVVALATATAAGGVFVTARVGALQFLSPAPDPTSSATPAESSRTSPGPENTSDGSDGPDEQADPAVLRLCRSYNAMAPNTRVNALNRPAMHALVAAAGGTGKVDSYCTVLLTSPQVSPGTTRGKSNEAAPGKAREDKVRPPSKVRPEKEDEEDEGAGGTPSGGVAPENGVPSGGRPSNSSDGARTASDNVGLSSPTPSPTPTEEPAQEPSPAAS